MDISKYDYIVLNFTDIDTQFKVYKKILEINGKFSQGTNSIDKDEPYWFYTVADYNATSGKTKMLLNLPKPKKRLFKKIISGKGNYNDYKLLQK